MKSLLALMGAVTGAMVTILGPGKAAAANLSFSGTFTQDDDVQLFNFSVVTDSTVIFRTYSYGGGTQADGTEILAGGFDPFLTLFDSVGSLVDFNDDDTTGAVTPDPSPDGQSYDAFLEVMLASGDYTLALTQYNNFPTGNLSSGFSQEGNSSFTGDLDSCATGSQFCDFQGNSRTNEWALDAFGVELLQEPDKEEPPVVKPPPVVIQPPVVSQPPVVQPPVVQPPVVQPPVVQPPAEDPVSVPEPTATVAIAIAGMLAMKKRRRGK
ncbi:MAG: DVUA0089 family protein [Cyanobacteria bacterium P01_D01_bin.156]